MHRFASDEASDEVRTFSSYAISLSLQRFLEFILSVLDLW